MCNAWNHSADCACGFGPPYSKGKIIIREQREWHESLPSNYSTFDRWLRRLRLESGDVEEGRKFYRRSLSDSGYPAAYKGDAAISRSARLKIIDWVRRVVSGYTYEALTTREGTINLPLFTLRSPQVKGSQVVYKDKKGIGQPKGWGITVFGTGLSPSREMRAEYGMEFYCTNGSCKQVYVPKLPVRIVVKKV